MPARGYSLLISPELREMEGNSHRIETIMFLIQVSQSESEMHRLGPHVEGR